ncbi:MAG: hypothetical protein V1809_16080 [Planctomycetota bacterium]
MKFPVSSLFLLGWLVAGCGGGGGVGGGSSVFHAADTGWAKTFGTTQNDEIAQVVLQTADGRLVFGGGGQQAFVDSLHIPLLVCMDASGAVIWQKIYGGSVRRGAVLGMIETADGGFFATGYSTWNNWVLSPDDAWVMKTDRDGELMWKKGYDGGGLDRTNAIRLTIDEGCVVGGSITTPSVASFGYFVMKLMTDGTVSWANRYGVGDNSDMGTDLQVTSDGGYIVSGWTSSDGSSYSARVLKLNAVGAVEWNRVFPGPVNASTWWRKLVIQCAPDGGYILAGTTNLLSSTQDAWVLKLDGVGNVIWQNAYGSEGDDTAEGISVVSDGGCIVTGQRDGRLWLFKLNRDGAILWEKVYGDGNAAGKSVIVLTSGDCLVGGCTDSVDSSFWGGDAWILQAGDDGSLDALDQTVSSAVTPTGVVSVEMSATVVGLVLMVTDDTLTVASDAELSVFSQESY